MSTVISVRLSEALREAIRADAAKQGVQVNALIVEALEDRFLGGETVGAPAPRPGPRGKIGVGVGRNTGGRTVIQGGKVAVQFGPSEPAPGSRLIDKSYKRK